MDGSKAQIFYEVQSGFIGTARIAALSIELSLEWEETDCVIIMLCKKGSLSYEM